jgi:LPS O-antigen subunit length determinant protein (WzzB/FepE family)
MATTAKSVIDSLRELLQDILVPELKALRVSMDSLRTEMQLRDEKTQESIRHLDQRTQESIRHLSEKLDYAIDIRERLGSLEARLPRQ